MVYSRKQEQLAAWIWMVLMAAVGSLGVRHAVKAVGEVFRQGISIATGSVFLLCTGNDHDCWYSGDWQNSYGIFTC